MKLPSSMKLRDLRRGCMIGLIAGVGYVLAYEIIQYFAEGTSAAQMMVALGWLLAIPVPAFLLWWLPRQISPDIVVEDDTADDDSASENDSDA